MTSFETLKPKIEQRPCPVCGGKEFEWGSLVGATYIPGKPFKPTKSGKMLRARCCVRCKHVDYFADAELTTQSRKVAIVAVLLGLLPGILVLLFLFLNRWI